MRDALVEILNKCDIAIASCRTVVNDEILETAVLVVRRVRDRLSYPDNLVVAALAGGTGSGKSSILNAIAGEEISDVGGVRPTTGTPLAIATPEVASQIVEYLGELGIEIRSSNGVPDWLVLIDLPDTDSVEVDHGLQVESLIPVVDVVVWVTDPEKYRDAVLHDRFLKPLAAYERQLIFVMNQSDRLVPGTVESVLNDLALALREDGIDESFPIATAANPTSGPPQGIDDLTASIADLADSGVGLYPKLVTDLQRAVSVLEGHVGGAGVDFGSRFDEVIAIASGLIVGNNDGAASSALTRFLEDLATETAGLVGEEIIALVVAVPNLLMKVGESLETVVVEHRRARPPIRWSEKGDSMPEGARVELVGRQLRSGLEPPLLELLGRRARANAALADLSLSLTSAASGHR